MFKSNVKANQGGVVTTLFLETDITLSLSRPLSSNVSHVVPNLKV